MKIIIAGAGRIGSTLTRILSEEGHDITVIEQKPETIYHISNTCDVICVEGSAVNSDTLIEAGAATADLLIAATEKDEVNMVCGISARKLGTRDVIARIRDPQFLRQSDFLREAFGLSVIINPEFECAKEISRILRFPSAARVETFSKSNAELVDHRVREGGKLDGIQLKDLEKISKAKVLIGVVDRDGNVFIPRGDFTLKGGDVLSITGSSREMRKFFVSAGEYKKPIKDAIIMGGGRISVYLSTLLLEAGIDVSVIEMDRDRCEVLCDLLPGAHIICGDGTSNDVLLEENIGTVGGFVALTGDDGDNIITSLYAKSCGVEKIVTKVNRDHYSQIIDDSMLESIVTPKEVISQQIARYVRAMDNSKDSSMETLYRLAGGKVEALEFRVNEDSKCIGIPLKDLPLREDVIIGAIIRESRTIIPNGSSVIQPGDHVIIITDAGKVKVLDAALKEVAG